MTPDEIAALNNRLDKLEARIDKWLIALMTAVLAAAGIPLVVD